jgi:valyl-tRNA synthetase
MAHPIIPFITEELWQKVSPVAGLSGKSVMVSPYPKLNAKAIDENADHEIETLKNMVTACRTLKAEMGIGPSERLPLIVAGDAQFLKKWEGVIRTLTKSREVQIIGDQLPERDSPTVNIEGYSLMLHIEIDPEQERKKISDGIERLKNEIKRDQQKLKNDGFVQKAPEKVVQQVREQLERHLVQLDQLERQFEKL